MLVNMHGKEVFICIWIRETFFHSIEIDRLLIVVPEALRLEYCIALISYH